MGTVTSGTTTCLERPFALSSCPRPTSAPSRDRFPDRSRSNRAAPAPPGTGRASIASASILRVRTWRRAALRADPHELPRADAVPPGAGAGCRHRSRSVRRASPRLPPPRDIKPPRDCCPTPARSSCSTSGRPSCSRELARAASRERARDIRRALPGRDARRDHGDRRAGIARTRSTADRPRRLPNRPATSTRPARSAVAFVCNSGGADGSRSHATGSIRGPPLYMAPSCGAASRATVQSDVYACWALCSTSLLAGQLPHQGKAARRKLGYRVADPRSGDRSDRCARRPPRHSRHLDRVDPAASVDSGSPSADRVRDALEAIRRATSRFGFPVPRRRAPGTTTRPNHRPLRASRRAPGSSHPVYDGCSLSNARASPAAFSHGIAGAEPQLLGALRRNRRQPAAPERRIPCGDIGLRHFRLLGRP